MPTKTWVRGITPLGYEQITNLGRVKKLSVPTGAGAALIKCEGADVRWRDDGVNPTVAVGMPLRVGEELLYEGPLDKFTVIQISVLAVLNIIYWG